MQQNMRAVKALYFFYFAAFAVFSVFINVYYRGIGLSGIQIGWINALAPLVGILGGPLWAVLSDRWGKPRLMMAAAVSGSALAVLGISTVRVFTWLLPFAGFWNLFSSILPPMLDTANLASLSDQSENYGRQRVWGTIGYIIASLLAGLIFERTGLSLMFGGYVLLMLVMLAIVPALPARPLLPHSELRLNIRSLVTRREWLLFAASLIPLWIAVNGMYAFLSVYLRDMGADARLIGAVSSVGALTEMPVMLLSAFFVRKVGLRKMLLVSYFLFGVRMLLYGLMPAPMWAIPITLTHGLTFGLFWVAGVIYINQLAPQNLKTTSQTLFFAIMNLAGVIGAPAGGWMYDHLGGGVQFRIYGALCVLSLLILAVGMRVDART